MSFLDLQPGAGTALTRKSRADDNGPQFNITLKADLLREGLSTFLNTKERRLFADDSSGFSASFDAGNGDALTYVLLHESSHVLDQALRVARDPAGRFGTGIWEDRFALAAPYADSIAARTPFRGLPPVPARHAPAYYLSLSGSPFVSFYATAAASEDLAELIAWYHLRQRGQRVKLTVRDRRDATPFEYEPLDGRAIQPRLAKVQALLERYERACGT